MLLSKLIYIKIKGTHFILSVLAFPGNQTHVLTMIVEFLKAFDSYVEFIVYFYNMQNMRHYGISDSDDAALPSAASSKKPAENRNSCSSETHKN